MTTNIDGSTLYSKSLTFLEDLALIEDSLTSYEEKFRPLDFSSKNEKPLSSKGTPKNKGEDEIISDEEEDEMYFGIKNPAQEELKKIEIN